MKKPLLVKTPTFPPRQAIVFENRFDMLNISSDWWDWAEATIVNQLRVAAMYNGQPPYGLRGYIGKIYIQILDPKRVAIVSWWSLFRGYLCNKKSKWDKKWWPL